MTVRLERRRAEPRWRDRFAAAFGVKEFAFAAFLVAGNFKADPRLEWLPVDLTILAALITIGFVARAIVHRPRLEKRMGLLVLFFVLFVPGLFFSEVSGFALDKMARFFTLTLLAALAPFFIITDRDSVRRLVNSLALLSFLLVGDALYKFFFDPREWLRLTGLSSNTIGLGLHAGFAAIWLLMLWVEKRLWVGTAIVGTAAMAVTLVAAGSRGPILAVCLAIVAMVVAFGRRVSRMRSRAAFGALLLLAAGLFFAPVAPVNSKTRLQQFFGGEFDASATIRQDLYEVSLPAVGRSPLGIGLGGFYEDPELGGSIEQPGSDLGAPYPHNLVLETGIEGGWLAMLWLLFLFKVSLERTARFGRTDVTNLSARLSFGFLVYLIAEAMVSGDLNDQRLMFAFMAVALSSMALARNEGEPVPLDGELRRPRYSPTFVPRYGDPAGAEPAGPESDGEPGASAPFPTGPSAAEALKAMPMRRPPPASGPGEGGTEGG